MPQSVEIEPVAGTAVPPVPEVPAAPGTSVPPAAEPAVGGEAGAPPAVETVPPRQKPSLQDRFDALSERSRQSEARAAAAEAARVAAEARAAELEKTQPRPEPPPEKPQPKREAFDTPDAYDAALVEWASERAVQRALRENEATNEQRRTREREETAQQAARAATQQDIDKALGEWQTRRAAFMANTPDYIEVAEADDVPISDAMSRAIIVAENGPEIAYWLGQHPDEAARIAGMVARGAYPAGHPLAGRPLPDVQRQLFELGKIAAKIAAPPVRASAAPPPLSPVRANNAAAPKSPDEMTMDEYEAMRRAQGLRY